MKTALERFVTRPLPEVRGEDTLAPPRGDFKLRQLAYTKV
jgi:hypothetical protein